MKQTPFSKLFKETVQLEKRYLRTLAAHKIYISLNKSIAANIQGKRKAEENVRAVSKYTYFYSTTKEATRCYFLIELAKFFDKDSRSRSIIWMLDYAIQNKDKLSKENYIQFHKDRKSNSILFDHYKSLSFNDLSKLKKRVLNNKDKIERLITYRNQELAHDDRNKDQVSITIAEMETLLKIVRDTVKLFYEKLDFASIVFDNFEKEPERDVDLLFRNLRKLEKGG